MDDERFFPKCCDPGIKMPKSESGIDNLGIRYEGPVLTGHLTVAQQLMIQGLASQAASSSLRELDPCGIRPSAPDTTPPPTPNCFAQQDPVYARQRESLGFRPDLYDPVLRYHLGRPPLPDAYKPIRDWEACREKERKDKDPR